MLLNTLSTRLQNVLMTEGLKDAYQVIKSSDEYLMSIPNFGKDSLREVRELRYYIVKRDKGLAESFPDME
jgi:DNA-directed RNA polymerase alpha subunit